MVTRAEMTIWSKSTFDKTLEPDDDVPEAHGVRHLCLTHPCSLIFGYGLACPAPRALGGQSETRRSQASCPMYRECIGASLNDVASGL